MSAAASLYIGRTVHERRAPFLHRFRYAVSMMLIDLDRLAELPRASRWMSLDRFNLFSFRERDHGARDGGSLRAWAQARFQAAGIDMDGARIRLLCSPRVLGFVFNPLSLYFAEDEDGHVRGVIYQVHNTFGDAHAYVAPAGQDREVLRQGADKIFHVSPFFDVAGRYRFTLRPPGERFKLTIFKQRETGPDFLATLLLHRRDASDGAFLRLFAAQPFSTLKTVAAIHWEALRLMLKGARYHSRPAPPEPSSLGHAESSVFGPDR